MTTHRAAPTTDRAYGGDHDYWAVRRLLVDTYATTSLDFNWDVRRWDGHRWHHDDVSSTPSWGDQARLWETGTGRIVAAVFHEDAVWGDVHPQVHHLHRDLERDVFSWAEENMEGVDREGRPQLATFVHDHDTFRRLLLEYRGWEMVTEVGWVHRNLHLRSWNLPESTVPASYRIRGTRPGSQAECDALANLLNRSFGTDIHTGRAVGNFVEHSPSFLHELNMVADPGDGTLAAHVGVNWDPANRLALLEPVCTDPDHRRHGLALALIGEGLRRARALGARYAHVSTGLGAEANELYERAGFVERHTAHLWKLVR